MTEKLAERRCKPCEGGVEPLGVRLDLGDLRHDVTPVPSPSLVARALAHPPEHRVEGAEHGLGLQQLPLIAEQADVPVENVIELFNYARGKGKY